MHPSICLSRSHFAFGVLYFEQSCAQWASSHRAHFGERSRCFETILTLVACADVNLLPDPPCLGFAPPSLLCLDLAPPS